MNRQRSNRSARSRGYALLLVVLTVSMSFILGLTFLYTSTTTTGIAKTMDEHAQSRQVAEAGGDAVIRYIDQTPSWRTTRAPGTWLTDLELAGGSVTVEADYTPLPTTTPVAMNDWSFEDAITSLSTPLLNPPMSGTIGGWEVQRTALLETGTTVPLILTLAEPDSTDGAQRMLMVFPLSMDGTATVGQTLAETLDPDTTYALRVDIGRQLLSSTLADVTLRVYAGGVLCASSTDLSLFSSFHEDGLHCSLETVSLTPTQNEYALRFTTDSAPPAGALRIEVHTEAMLGALSQVTIDNIRFEKEQYSDLEIDVLGTFGSASHRVVITIDQAASPDRAGIVRWSEP